MSSLVGQHQVTTFTSPVNGTAPIDANTVRSNDNTLKTAYDAHDNDATIHLQDSTLAARPVASVVGQKWFTNDGYRLYYDDGAAWHEAAYVPIVGGTMTGALAITSASANALAVGLAGATNPAFNVDASTALQAAGLNIIGAIAAGTVAIVVISSGSNANLSVNAKGTGTIAIGSVSTGAVTITPATTIGGVLSIGSTVASAGQIRIGYGVAIQQRNRVNSADLVLAGAGAMVNDDYIEAGSTSGTGLTGFSWYVGSSTARMSLTSTALTLTGTIATADPSGGAGVWKLGIANAVSPTSPNRTITIDIGGTLYYLAAKTTNN